MISEIPVFFHYAVSLVHRKVAIASFLLGAQALGHHVYYREQDPAAIIITEVSTLVGVGVLGLTARASPRLFEPWVLIKSHRSDVLPDLNSPRAPRAILCLGPASWSNETPILPDKHKPFITGMRWR